FPTGRSLTSRQRWTRIGAMLNLHISSVEPAFQSAQLLMGLTELMSRVVAMGLLHGKPIERLDADAIRRVLDALQAGCLLGTQRARFVAMLRPNARKPESIVEASRAVRQLIAVLDESPVPRTEWPAM